MQILEWIAKKKLGKLEKELVEFYRLQNFYPIESFGYERINLGIALCDVKMAFWRAFIPD